MILCELVASPQFHSRNAKKTKLGKRFGRRGGVGGVDFAQVLSLSSDGFSPLFSL
jgi:hypothetical protein